MATLAATPISAPAFDYTKWREQETKYLNDLFNRAKNGPDGANPLTGRTIKFQVADGYAVYVVAKVNPLTLWHVGLGDGYSISSAHIRGLTLRDVKALVAREDAWQGIFDEHERYISSLRIGDVVHYNDGFNRYVRCVRVEGEKGKRLRPIALVGEWRDYDLPRRNVDGTITRSYMAERIANGEAYEPNYSNIYEASESLRLRATHDPRRLDPIDLSVPDMTPEQERVAALARRLDSIRALVAETPRQDATYEHLQGLLHRVVETASGGR